MRRAVLVVVALAFVGAALLPLAAASHTMGHRYLVYGRILGSDGMPMQEKDVVLKILSGQNSIASINTRTDCFGDFENWDGSPGNDPAGGGRIEQQPKHNPPYIAFHFHDPELSNQLRVQVNIAGESWTESFHSETRQTSVRHQLAVSSAPAPSCGNFDQFNGTFTMRVSALAPGEMVTGDVEPRTRTVRVFFDDREVSNGTTDYNGAFLARISNSTALAAVGTRVRVETTDIGARSYTLSAEDAKFHRLDQVALVEDALDVSDFKPLWWFLGIAAGVCAILGLFWVYSRVRSGVEENRLRETTTRRRFRKGGD